MSADPLAISARGVACARCGHPLDDGESFEDHDCPGPAPSRDARDAIDAAARGGGPA